jgi:hypothetical protein
MPLSTGHTRIETGPRAVTILTRVIHTHTERPLRLGFAMVWRTRICVGMLAPWWKTDKPQLCKST